LNTSKIFSLFSAVCGSVVVYGWLPLLLTTRLKKLQNLKRMKTLLIHAFS